MRMSKYVLAFGAVSLAFAPRLAQADGPADDHVRFTGTFRYAGKPAEDDLRKAAVDRAIDSLFFAIKGIARSRLTSETQIDPWVQVSFDRGLVRVKTPSGPDAVAPESGAPVDYTADGETSKLTERFGNGRLVQIFATDDGKRTNEFVVLPDGNTLQVKVTIASPKLSAPMIYNLTYRRTP